MQLRNWIPVLASAILFVLQGTASQAQEAIGKATSVRPQAEGSRAGLLSGGSDVHSRRRFALEMLVRRICNFATAANSRWDQARASSLISSSMTRINLAVPSLSKQHAARFDL